MTTAIPLHRLRLAAVLLTVALGQACSPLGSRPDQILVTSEPPGAEVYVMGERLGTTPLNLNQHAVFPQVFPAGRRAQYGSIELRKPGCKDSVQRVSTQLLARGVHVRLECDARSGAPPAVSRPAEPEAHPDAAGPGADKPGTADDSSSHGCGTCRSCATRA